MLHSNYHIIGHCFHYFYFRNFFILIFFIRFLLIAKLNLNIILFIYNIFIIFMKTTKKL